MPPSWPPVDVTVDFTEAHWPSGILASPTARSYAIRELKLEGEAKRAFEVTGVIPLALFFRPLFARDIRCFDRKTLPSRKSRSNVPSRLVRKALAELTRRAILSHQFLAIQASFSASIGQRLALAAIIDPELARTPQRPLRDHGLLATKSQKCCRCRVCA